MPHSNRRQVFLWKRGLMRFGILILFLIFSSFHVEAIELQKIDFFQKGEVSKLVLKFDRTGVKAKKFHVPEDKQIILDIKGVKANEKVMRAMDTSEFSGSVVMITPYRKPGSPKDLRLAIQLRENIRSLLAADENVLTLQMENRFGVFTKKKYDKARANQTAVNELSERLLVPKSDAVEDILENLTLSGNKKYIGKKISFNVKDVTIVDALKMIADASGFNIILGKEVENVPNVTLSLTNIPWDQALDTILDLGKLVANKNGNILMISTLEKATQDKRKRLEAEALNKREEPLVTKIFPVSFSAPGDLAKIMNEYLTPNRGKISIDDRTNSLIVKDTPDIIEKLKKIVKTLDTQTPQIQVNAKIVEMRESFAQQIGLRRGLTFGYDPVANNDFDGDRTDEGPGFSISSAPTGDAPTLFGLNIASFSRLRNLDLTLQLMENRSQGKVISTPKVVMQNGESAEITTTDTTSYPVTIVSDSGVAQQEFRQISADLALKVKPEVTNDGSIFMEIDLKKAGFGTRPSANGPPDLQSNALKTNVLVDNGSTVVIGGVYTSSKLTSESGIPFLMDLPLVGWLFRTPHNPQTEKKELIIFLTPRIINLEEAGLVDRGPNG